MLVLADLYLERRREVSERTAVLLAGLSVAALLGGMVVLVELDRLLAHWRVTRRRRARAGWIR